MTKLRVAEEKTKLALATLAEKLPKVLDDFQTALFDRAVKFRDDNTVSVESWDDFVDVFTAGESKFVYAHWDGTTETEDLIKEETKATIRCIPLDGEGPAPEPGECIKTGNSSKQRVLFAKAY